jgi:hypothetical protein
MPGSYTCYKCLCWYCKKPIKQEEEGRLTLGEGTFIVHLDCASTAGYILPNSKRKLETESEQQKEKKQKVKDTWQYQLHDELASVHLYIGPKGDWVLPWKRGSEFIVPLGEDFPMDDHGHKCFKRPVNDEVWGTLMEVQDANQHGVWSFSIKVTNPPSRETMVHVKSGLPVTINRGDVVTMYYKEGGALDCYGVCETPAQALISAQLVDVLLKRKS